MSISIVVLAYNEEASIRVVVQELLGELALLGVDYELVLVDDGSNDGTGGLVDQMAADLPRVRAIHHPVNLGLGGGYRTGFAEARKQYVSFWPADGQFPAKIISQFFPLMNDTDLVLGYVPQRDCSLPVKFLSWSERLLNHVLFGSLPRFQGILMFRRQLLEHIPLHSSGRGWGVLWEFIIRATRKGYRIRSVPTEIRPRMAGASKVSNFSTIWANLVEILTLYKNLS